MLTWIYSNSNGFYLIAFSSFNYSELYKELISFKGEYYFKLNKHHLGDSSIEFDGKLSATTNKSEIVDEDFINFKLKPHIKRYFIECCFSKRR